MSQRDRSFKSLSWAHNGSDTAFQARGVGDLIYTITVVRLPNGSAGYLPMKGYDLCEIYSWLKDAQTICQLDHEARIKRWLYK